MVFFYFIYLFCLFEKHVYIFISRRSECDTLYTFYSSGENPWKHTFTYFHFCYSKSVYFFKYLVSYFLFFIFFIYSFIFFKVCKYEWGGWAPPTELSQSSGAAAHTYTWFSLKIYTFTIFYLNYSIVFFI